MFIENTSKVKVVQYRPEFATYCSIGKRPFYGHLEIEFYPGNRLLEFMAFDEWVHSLHEQEFTIESLCDTVFDKLTDILGVIPLSVEVSAITLAHSPVSCARIRTLEDIKRNPVRRELYKPTKGIATP